METAGEFDIHAVNLGIFDGQVAHAHINGALALAPKVILFGEQTRLPYFPDDQRLPKLHAGDPLVLLFWKVLQKIPDTLRYALIESQLSITLIRGEGLLYYDNYRCHQAVHIGRRRHSIYLAEVLLHEAADKGYDHWAIAEGIIYASWMLLDFLLLVDLFKSHRKMARQVPNYRLGEPQFLKLIGRHNLHRRDSVDQGRSEVREFVDAYKGELVRYSTSDVAAGDPVELAHQVFDAQCEQRWAYDKMARIAQVFNYPRMFLFDRDIIHGIAHDLAVRRGEDIAPQTFADALHDYQDAQRFDPKPLLAAFCKGVVPKPRAAFLEKVVELGEPGLRAYFEAYRQGEETAQDLVHGLWMYLCSLSSDAAGVFSRLGRCRAWGRGDREEGEFERALCGILVRLDKAPNYAELSAQVVDMGAAARDELVELIERQRLEDEDEWEVFKGRKQSIVMRACELLEQMQGTGGEGTRSVQAAGIDLHQDEIVVGILQDGPHRHTSDPSAVLMYLRNYQRSFKDFGPGDPDTGFLLACVLIRMDRSEHYNYLLEQIPRLGVAALSAMYSVSEQIPERDMNRRTILTQARIISAQMLAQTRALARRERSR